MFDEKSTGLIGRAFNSFILQKLSVLIRPHLGNPKNNTLSCISLILVIILHEEKTWFSETRSNPYGSIRKDKYHYPLY